MLDNDIIGHKINIKEDVFVIVPSLNKKQECVSLYNEKNDLYIRHFLGKIITSGPSLHKESYLDDSSFIPESIDGKFALRCSNNNLEKLYICVNSENEYIVSDKISKFLFSIPMSEEKSYKVLYEHLSKNYAELSEKVATEKANNRLKLSCEKIRSISRSIHKKNRIVFIGTGKLGENTQYVFMKLYEIIKQKNLDIDILYFARSKIEKDFFDVKHLPCEIWSSLIYEHIQYALLAKVAVFSTHTLANGYSNSVLMSCLSGAFRIQLWHGFLAKMVAASTLQNKKDLVVISNMLEDSCVDIVTTAILSDKIQKQYQICFPGAKICCTGDARTDMLFYNNPHKMLDKWINNNHSKIFIIISPTYRETKEAAIKYINDVIEFISCASENIAFAIKFHPIYFNRFDENEKNIYTEKIKNSGCFLLNERDDSYIIMNKFDAMITDYSSIRFDFMITEKPVVLFRPDYSEYITKRKINPIQEFDMIDNISYNIDVQSANALYEIVVNDSNKQKRISVLNSLNIKRDGESSRRVIQLIFEKCFPLQNQIIN